MLGAQAESKQCAEQQGLEADTGQVLVDIAAAFTLNASTALRGFGSMLPCCFTCMLLLLPESCFVHGIGSGPMGSACFEECFSHRPVFGLVAHSIQAASFLQSLDIVSQQLRCKQV